MLKLNTLGQLTKPSLLKYVWNPEFSSLKRFSSKEPICSGLPPKKTGTGLSSPSVPVKPPASKKTEGESSKGTVYCEGRNGRKRTALYSKDTLMMHYEVWPIIAIVALEVCGFFFMVIWISQTRDEVKYFKKSKNHIQSLDLLNPPKRKLWVEKQQYKPMKELHDIYKAMKEMKEMKGDAAPPKTNRTCKKPHCRFF